MHKKLPKQSPHSLGFSKYCLEFDGVNDWIDFGQVNCPESGTILVWFSAESGIEDWAYLLTFWTDLDNRLSITVDNSVPRKIGSGALEGGTTLWSFRPVEVEGKGLMHLALTWNASKAEMFLNDVSVAEAAGDKTITLTNPDLRIGSQNGSVNWWKGIIDEVLIYSRALPPAERRYSMLNYHNPIREGLILWLPFEEGTGAIAYDKSGYGNNGTIYGATWKKVKMWELRAEAEL